MSVIQADLISTQENILSGEWIKLFSEKIRSRIILLAIKPRFAKAIYRGEKKIEFRKKIPTAMLPKNGNNLVGALLYESAPVSAVTGGCLLSLAAFSPNGVFSEEIIKSGCLTSKELNDYFVGKPGYALSVSEPVHWENAKKNF